MDKISKAKRSAIMSRIRGHGNQRTDKNVVILFRKIGIKDWRRHQIVHFNVKRLHGNIASDGTIFKAQVRPDFLFSRLKIALFVDGCFWHGCPACYRKPKSRRAFWMAKILRNKERDQFQLRQLKRTGWRVIRIREHELLRENEARLIRRIQKGLKP
jgi:DNA mismatch endonuclease (patch repair protein)